MRVSQQGKLRLGSSAAGNSQPAKGKNDNASTGPRCDGWGRSNGRRDDGDGGSGAREALAIGQAIARELQSLRGQTAGVVLLVNQRLSCRPGTGQQRSFAAVEGSGFH